MHVLKLSERTFYFCIIVHVWAKSTVIIFIFAQKMFNEFLLFIKSLKAVYGMTSVCLFLCKYNKLKVGETRWEWNIDFIYWRHTWKWDCKIHIKVNRIVNCLQKLNNLQTSKSLLFVCPSYGRFFRTLSGLELREILNKVSALVLSGRRFLYFHSSVSNSLKH